MEDIYNCLFFNSYNVEVINGREDDYNYEILEPIKENVYTSVYKAKKIRQKELDSEPDKFVAIKKIFIDRLKEELKFELVKDEITDDDIKPEIEKFNLELENMKICDCENSVSIYDYYQTDKEFIIIMELCDDS